MFAVNLSVMQKIMQAKPFQGSAVLQTPVSTQNNALVKIVQTPSSNSWGYHPFEERDSSPFKFSGLF